MVKCKLPKHLSIIILFFTLFTFNIHAQEIEVNVYNIDTIQLGEFQKDKVVMYELNNATICLDTGIYLGAIKRMHTRYKKWSSEAKEGDVNYYNFKKRFRVIDSIYNLVKYSMDSVDTVYVSYKAFRKVELSDMILFGRLIENNKCAVFDKEGNRQYTIIRKEESYTCGPLCGWGGWRFYFLDKEKHFAQIDKWVS